MSKNINKELVNREIKVTHENEIIRGNDFNLLEHSLIPGDNISEFSEEEETERNQNQDNISNCVNEAEFVSNQEINREHSSFCISSASKIINPNDIISNIYIPVIETKPRFAIGHKLKNKNLDNSVFEDYLCYEVVDDKGCEEFRSYTHKYINRKLLNKGDKLFNSIRFEIKNLISSNIDVDNISLANFFIMKGLIDDSIYVPKKRENSCIYWCKKKVEPLKVQFSYNFKKITFDLRKNILQVKKNIVSTISSDEKVESIYLENIMENIKEYLNKKLDYLFEVHKINEKLKEEVDSYWEYFNIKKIVSKQINKLKSQEKKINLLGDARSQNECIICMEGDRNVIFYPCLHFICCETCSFVKIGNDCPQCHSRIDNKKLTLT